MNMNDKTKMAALLLSAALAASACSSPDGNAPPSKTATTGDSPPVEKAAPAPAASGIVKVSATHYVVDRAVLAKLGERGEGQGQGERRERIVPETADGKPMGMRLFGVRPDSVLGQLGFENGDRVESVNGLPLTSPEKATEAWTQVKGADHVVVQLQRRGESLKVDYDLK